MTKVVPLFFETVFTLFPTWPAKRIELTLRRSIFYIKKFISRWKKRIKNLYLYIKATKEEVYNDIRAL